MTGITVAQFQQCLERFLAVAPELQATQPALHEQFNFDQLKIIAETLSDYNPGDQCPSYVMGIACRPILRGLQHIILDTGPLAPPNVPLD